MQEVIIRSADSGVWLGKLDTREGSEVKLTDAIRIWYWSGAASLSQLAVDGVKNPEQCKFAVPVDVTVLGVCEVIVATDKAVKCIREVPSWKV
jgi:hypothetical protein